MNSNIERSLYISIHLLFQLNHNDNACVNPCEPRTLLSRGTYTLALLCELIQAVFQLKVWKNLKPKMIMRMKLVMTRSHVCVASTGGHCPTPGSPNWLCTTVTMPPRKINLTPAMMTDVMALVKHLDIASKTSRGMKLTSSKLTSK